MEVLQKLARECLDKLRNEVGKEPDRFDEFIQFRELEDTIGLSLNDCFEAWTHGNKKVMRAFDEKFPLEKVEPIIKMFGLEGIGFGSSFPELTEKMYGNAYEDIDMDAWSKHRAHGLAISEKPTIISLEEQEETVLQMLAAYMAEYYPELLDPLGLRGYLEGVT